LLATELAALNLSEYDLALTGFEPREVTELLARASGGRTDPDEVPAPPINPVAKNGDLWLLGGHRLLCGDSTSLEAVATLMGAEKADMVFTDPPYNVDYDAEARPNGPTSAERKARPLGKIQNDKKSPAEFRAFLDLVYQAIDSVLKPGRALYICHADTEGHHFRNAFLAMPWKLQSCLIWSKTVMVFGRADYHWQHEPVLYGWKEGAAHVWHGDRRQTTIIEVATDHMAPSSSDTAGVYVHPTQKPVALIEQALTNSSLADELVLDLFGGSGSTLIACQKMGRWARLMELDAKYVDVIIVRWQNFTGKAATLAGDGRTFAELTEDRLRH
jgi:DNA modification methylase